MNDWMHRMPLMVLAMRMLAALVLVVTTCISAAPGLTAQRVDSDEPYSLHIRADNTDDWGTTFGARYTVTALDGEYLGSCTLEGDPTSPPWQYCRVDVPAGIKVVVWQDPASIPAGYAAVQNPIVFDTAIPTTTPHKIDVVFENAPQPGGGSPVAALVAALISILQTILASIGR